MNRVPKNYLNFYSTTEENDRLNDFSLSISTIEKSHSRNFSESDIFEDCPISNHSQNEYNEYSFESFCYNNSSEKDFFNDQSYGKIASRKKNDNKQLPLHDQNKFDSSNSSFHNDKNAPLVPINLTTKDSEIKKNIVDGDKRNVLKESSEFLRKKLMTEIELIMNDLIKNENESIFKKFLNDIYEIIAQKKIVEYLYSQHNSSNIKSYLDSKPLNYIIGRIKTYSNIEKKKEKMYIFTKFHNIENIEKKVNYIIDTYENYQMDLEKLFFSSMTIKEYYEDLKKNAALSESQIKGYEKLLNHSMYKKKYGKEGIVEITHKTINIFKFTSKKRSSNITQIFHTEKIKTTSIQCYE